MLTPTANRDDTRFSFWPRVREFAVPASMIETATARRHAGDWAGACAAAHLDVDLDLRAVAAAHGRDLASRIRADLRHLAPDLLRWHLPRVAPDGLLRPGLTVALARYDRPGRDDTKWPVHLVVRTPPAWADAGQRISLAVWDGSHDGHPHPHPKPNRRFRLDLHRHLWDARRTDELRERAGTAPDGCGRAVDRWADEAEILLRADATTRSTSVLVRLRKRQRLVLDGVGASTFRITEPPPRGDGSALPVLPDAATWAPPDLELIRAGAIDVDRLHPLVASALVPGHEPAAAGSLRADDRAGRPRLVECRGDTHRIGLVDGVLVPLDHEPGEIRREELLVALTGTPLPCLQAIDDAHRRPDCLTGVRERLVHGDIAGALAVVEGLLGADAVLRDGALRDELEAAARRRITYGLFRAGLATPGPRRVGLRPSADRPRGHRSHPRHTLGR
ncbi:hypothetical protein ABZ725_50130 [Streptomyces sp. NPDC006872]|uniref:hypothetical protein n=1 Tax=Streptomyces sp. NPDC006872 TaxID=3155720 RepID=UPI0033C48E0E